MELMEADLVKDPFPEFSLRRKLENVETDWNKAENYYDHFYDHSLTLTEDDRLAYEEFQTRYLDLSGRVEDALEDYRLEEEARERDRLKVAKVRQLGDRWEAAYQHVETVLGDLKTRLEGEPFDNVELLGVHSAQLEEVKAHISLSATLVDSMFTEDPEQTVITREAQGTRTAQAEIKVHAC